MNVMRVGIADDEPLARERIRSLLDGRPGYEIIVECSDGAEAAAALRERELDVFFLDVQMPDLDGFQALEAAGNPSLPIIVFVTAFHDNAIRAFEVRALDYLLKPFGRERFGRALERARPLLEQRGSEAAVERAQEALTHGPVPRLFVRDAGRIVPIRVAAIERLQACDDDVIVHAAGRQFRISAGVSRARRALRTA